MKSPGGCKQKSARDISSNASIGFEYGIQRARTAELLAKRCSVSINIGRTFWQPLAHALALGREECGERGAAYACFPHAPHAVQGLPALALPTYSMRVGRRSVGSSGKGACSSDSSGMTR